MTILHRAQLLAKEEIPDALLALERLTALRAQLQEERGLYQANPLA